MKSCYAYLYHRYIRLYYKTSCNPYQCHPLPFTSLKEVGKNPRYKIKKLVLLKYKYTTHVQHHLP